MVKKQADQIMFFQQRFWLQTKDKAGVIEWKERILQNPT